ncbi:MAG: hypothetical protein A3E80_00045 [Chlamydiae bacterium RIFCSPHIGHO2_12_FULL_49_9]|nr:MAG: hypothetical protein A3E80_00045 [Chlamydiae bacterium RIFCSPHIGHO2_12_FULL_49_9]
MRAIRAEKSRTDPISQQPTCIAGLAGIGSLYEFYAYSISLRSICYTLYQKIIAKTIKLAASSFPNMFFFRDFFDFQVFQNKNRILRSFGRFSVGFCRHIRRSYKPNSGAFHLRTQRGQIRFINLFVKRQSAACLTRVKAYFGNALLISVEFLNSFPQVFRFFKSDRYTSLYQHANGIPLKENINNLKWRSRFPLALKDEVPARAI